MTVTIENKTTAIQLSETENVRYADLLMTVMNKPIPEGYSLANMRRDLRIYDILETKRTDSELELNQEDFKYLAGMVANSVWPMRHKDIVEFGDYIASK